MPAADLRRIQSYLRVAAPRGRDQARIGAFLATFSRETDNPYLNYAIPDDDATPAPADVAALVRAYRTRNRKPRLEYVPEIAPAVEAGVVAAGFVAESRAPLMVYAGGEAPGVPDGIELLRPETDAEVRDAAAVQWEAYGESGAVADHAVAGLRRTLDGGGFAVFARDAAGERAGAGVCTIPHGGSTELAGVAVREPFRRRGIAAAIAAWLAREAAASGCDNVFLMAEGDAEARIYRRAGFVDVGEVLHISLPADEVD